jgi:hypothetical protein
MDASVSEVNNILKEAGSTPAFPVIARRNSGKPLKIPG